jgi:23S rRNA (pseudouridine1915-N3)-methyltransferase
MRILIAAIGKLKDEEERAIVARYAKRFDQGGKALGLGPLEILEFPECRLPNADARKADEAGRLLKTAAASGLKIALDESGQPFSSAAFARLLSRHADGAVKQAAFFIGGPDGHGKALLDSVDLRLSLGPMTLPHGLARVVLTEQLYRAATILAGHPYHRT